MKAELTIPTVQYGSIKVEAEGTVKEIVETYYEFWRESEEQKNKDLEANKPF